MCLGLPGKVLAVIDGRRARIQVGGTERSVDLSLLADAATLQPGDYLITHAGLAMERIGEDEALEIQRLLEGFGEEVSA